MNFADAFPGEFGQGVPMKRDPENPDGLRRGHEDRPFELEDGKRYYHLSAAARIVGVQPRTLWHWAHKGVTSHGVDLKVYDFHGWRLLIPEESLMALKERLHPQPSSKKLDAPNP
jgi:predicted restriction endonuclease